jgi:chemotaxis protein methyltransferase CheR
MINDQEQMIETNRARIQDVEDIELKLLLEAIFERYGYDFRQYSATHLKRQFWEFAKREGLASLSSVQDTVLHHPSRFKHLLRHLSISTTSLFRDPEFYRAFRERIVPILKTFPYLRIWHAGCSTGEEVYSMAILLYEENIYDRARIYATDFHEGVLEEARSGTLQSAAYKEYERNYYESGGKSNFSHYFIQKGEKLLLFGELLRNVTFAQHNLVTDDSFMEFNAILCRNVLIYFNKILQDRVHDLIYKSLSRFGILNLGKRESLQFSSRAHLYRELDPNEKLYQKIR